MSHRENRRPHPTRRRRVGWPTWSTWVVAQSAVSKPSALNSATTESQAASAVALSDSTSRMPSVTRVWIPAKFSPR